MPSKEKYLLDYNNSESSSYLQIPFLQRKKCTATTAPFFAPPCIVAPVHAHSMLILSPILQQPARQPLASRCSSPFFFEIDHLSLSLFW